MQINRLFEMLYILMDKECVTSKQFAERFEVSVRTVYRDVETLCQAGIPIYMSKGRGGGISLLSGCILNKTVLTKQERQDILTSLMAVSAIDFNEKNTAFEKLASLFGEDDTDWIEVDFSMWADGQKETELFPALKWAILSKKRITFSYSSSGGQQMKRDAEPLKLCFKGGAWYIYAYCRTRCDFRFFKLKRIKQLQISEQEFERRRPRQIFSKINPLRGEMVTLKMRFSSEMAFRVYDEVEHYEQLEDGSFLVEIQYPKGDWLFGYVASFGNGCEVLEPEEIRNEIKEKLKEIASLYS